MRGILLISHGQYAEAFKGSLKMIAGEVTNLYSCCLLPTDGPEQFKEKLNALKPEYREALYLVYFEDMSYHMAAQVMNKNERQITNLIYRGKQSLKAILEKEGFQYADK